MKATDFHIEHLDASTGFIQGWGKVCGRSFQFTAKHGAWAFAVFENGELQPFDIDIPGEHARGMYITQLQKPGEMSKDEAVRVLRRCADAYLYMIGRRQGDLGEPA